MLNATEESSDIWQLTAIDEGSNEITADGYVNIILQPSASSCLTIPSYNCEPKDMPERTTCDDDRVCKYWRRDKMGFTTYSLDELNGTVNKTKAPLRTPTAGTVLECRSRRPIAECFAVHVATGEKYLTQNGPQDIRYSAYKTDLKNRICHFEFPMVINVADGQWRIELMSRHHNGNTTSNIAIIMW